MTDYRSTTSLDLFNVDILTLLFDLDECHAREDSIIHIEASDPSISFTRSQTRTLAKRVAFGLREKFGIGSSGPGKDVVSVISSGQAVLPILFYGIVAAGGVYAPAGITATASDLARQIRQGESRLLVCSDDTKDVALEAAKMCSIPTSRVLILRSKPTPSLTILGTGIGVISDQELEWRRIMDLHTLKTTMVCLLFSSGTSGLPKAVCTSHHNLVAQTMLFGHNGHKYVLATEKSTMPFKQRVLACLPTAHIAGLVAYFLYSFWLGGQVYWLPKFDFDEFLAYHRKFELTFVFAVPPIYLAIAKSQLVTNQLDSLRVALCAAAPLGKDLQQLASAKLGKGKTHIKNIWGISETTGAITDQPWGEDDDTGSVGKIVPNMSLRIVDEDDHDVKPGTRGEILCKGPIVSQGYHNNPQANKDGFVDGYFRTGDIGEIRNDRVYIVDRKKDLIKYNAMQVAPAELETVLLSHPAIADAAVIGVEGEGTELPRAYVVADRKRLTEQQIKDFVKARVTGYKQLRGGVVFMDAIPKNPTGKILKKDLRALTKAEGRAKL